AQTSIACGQPMANIRSGIVMNGPIPIMFVMLSAVAWTRPNRRVRFSAAPLDARTTAPRARSAQDGSRHRNYSDRYFLASTTFLRLCSIRFQFCSECFRASSVSLLRSEEHTSELQSPYDLVCRLLLEKKKT